MKQNNTEKYCLTSLLLIKTFNLYGTAQVQFRRRLQKWYKTASKNMKLPFFSVLVHVGLVWVKQVLCTYLETSLQTQSFECPCRCCRYCGEVMQYCVHVHSWIRDVSLCTQCFTCWVKYTRNAELDNLISVFVDSTPKLFNNVTVRLLKAYFQYNIDTYLTKPGKSRSD